MTEPVQQGTPELKALIEAAWLVLDDMGADRTSCCLYAKAQLRLAFEAFRDPELDMDMPLDTAAEIVRSVTA